MLSIELGTEILKQGTKLKLSGAERITDMIIEKKQEEVKNITYKDRRTFPPSFTIDYINYLKGYVVGFGSIMYGLFRIFTPVRDKNSS